MAGASGAHRRENMCRLDVVRLVLFHVEVDEGGGLERVAALLVRLLVVVIWLATIACSCLGGGWVSRDYHIHWLNESN